jgi:hydroxyacylglutathione hydrolase
MNTNTNTKAESGNQSLPIYEAAAGYLVIPLRVSFLQMVNYSYIIIDQAAGLAAIVDPAWEIDAIVGMLDRYAVSLTAILLTHSHKDHVNLAEPLARRYDARVYMAEVEIEYYRFACMNLTGMKDGGSIQIGSTLITCLVTPGHTAGSACYLLPDCLFTGDTVFMEGCGKCTSAGSDPSQLFRSLQRIKSTLSPHIRIYPGHSFGFQPGWRLDELIPFNVYLQFVQEEAFIRFRMRKYQPKYYRFH